jgi:molybdate transport system substrate-binding protein
MVALLLVVASPAPLAAQPLTVSAASSLADVIADAGRAWQAAGGTGITVNAGGSNVLARQVAAGARVDVFISADRAQMDVAARSGRLVDPSIRDLLSNTLVVIVPGRTQVKALPPQDLATPRIRRIALANPDSVPAGVYARQWLERIGLWSAVASRVVPTLTVRSALAAVRAGRADAGVVFATDARTAPEVTVVYAVPAADAPGIRYPVAVVRGPREADAARFVQFLFSPEAKAVFETAGFQHLGS